MPNKYRDRLKRAAHAQKLKRLRMELRGGTVELAGDLDQLCSRSRRQTAFWLNEGVRHCRGPYNVRTGQLEVLGIER